MQLRSTHRRPLARWEHARRVLSCAPQELYACSPCQEILVGWAAWEAHVREAHLPDEVAGAAQLPFSPSGGPSLPAVRHG